MHLFGFEYNLENEDIFMSDPNNENRLKEVINTISTQSLGIEQICEHDLPYHLCVICPLKHTYTNCQHELPLHICMICNA